MATKALRIVKEICEENNISFFLIGGTTIGAIRHKGFIPWDDDIDIGMKYEDYLKFNEVIEEIDLGEFKFSSYFHNGSHPGLFSKIVYNGKLCIDIFPIVRTSDNILSRKCQWIFSSYIRRLYRVKTFNYQPRRVIMKIIVWFINLFSRYFTREIVIKLAQWNESRFENKKTRYYINLYGIYSMNKELIKEEWINELKPVLFEGDFYPAFAKTDEYLTHLYGDYMTLPPEDQRVPSHTDAEIIQFK